MVDVLAANWDKVGAIGEWVGGGAAALALALTGWALLRETRDRKAEAEERRAEATDRRAALERQNQLDEERRREHALALRFHAYDYKAGDRRLIHITLRNVSTTAQFYDVVVDHTRPGFRKMFRTYGTMAAGVNHDQTINEPGDLAGDFLRLRYTDHVGRRWQQGHEGRLSDATDDD